MPSGDNCPGSHSHVWLPETEVPCYYWSHVGFWLHQLFTGLWREEWLMPASWCKSQLPTWPLTPCQWALGMTAQDESLTPIQSYCWNGCEDESVQFSVWSLAWEHIAQRITFLLGCPFPGPLAGEDLLGYFLYAFGIFRLTTASILSLFLVCTEKKTQRTYHTVISWALSFLAVLPPP